MNFKKQLVLLVFTVGAIVPLSLFAQEKPHIYVKSIYSLPLTLDPIQMNDVASIAVGNLIYDGLLKFSPELELEGALAESWFTSKDGKVISFKLRDQAVFHSGISVTAEDVKASLTRAMSNKSKVKNLYSSIKDIKVKDDKNLDVILKKPFPPFLSVLAGSTAKILPKTLINNKSFFDKPIGSGAFTLENIDKQKKEISLNAFSSYYLGQPKIAKMLLKETTEEVAVQLAKVGELHDLSIWPLTENNDVFSLGQKISSPVASTWIIGINTTKPPFNDLKIRQLFKNQIPTEKFRIKFYPDAIKANGYIPNGLVGSDTDFSVSISNIKPPKTKVTIVIPKELSRTDEMKDFFETSMKQQGWNLEVKTMEWSQLMKGYANKSLQSFLVSMNMDYPDADFLLKNFESSNSDNFSGLKNKEIDSLLQQSREAQDRKEREQLYKKALSLIEESAVTVNLFYPRANYWISKCVQNLKPNMLSEVYIDYSKVTLDENCLAKKLVSK